MQASKLVLIVAAAAGILATVLAFAYIKSATVALEEQRSEPMVSVLFVATDLPADHVIDPDVDFRPGPIGAKSAPDLARGAIKEDEMEALRGRRISAPLPAGVPLMYSHLATLQDLDLAPGTRAMSIEVDSTGTMGGILVPGDHVDVLVSYETTPAPTAPVGLSGVDPMDPQETLGAILSAVMQDSANPTNWQSELVLANVRVIAVGNRMQASRQQFLFGIDGEGDPFGSSDIITLELTTEQALNYHRASAGGANPVSLLLRPPAPDSRILTGAGSLMQGDQ